jgi:RecA/RadA recombinase
MTNCEDLAAVLRVVLRGKPKDLLLKQLPEACQPFMQLEPFRGSALSPRSRAEDVRDTLAVRLNNWLLRNAQRLRDDKILTDLELELLHRRLVDDVDQVGAGRDLPQGYTISQEEVRRRQKVIAAKLSASLLDPADTINPAGEAAHAEADAPRLKGGVPGLSPADPETADVHRPALVSSLANATSTSRVVFIWGESGNGKTSLALNWLLREQAASPLPVCRVRLASARSRLTGEPSPTYRQDLIRALRIWGVQAETWTADALEEAFKASLRQGGTCAGVLLDDARDEDLQRLLPEDPAVPILITSLWNLHWPGSKVPVGAFEPSEARDAARTYLPDANDDDLEDLVVRLGRRPVAIALAGGLVRTGLVALPEMLEALSRDAASALESMYVGGAGNEPPIGRLYETLLAALASMPRCLETLDVILWASDGLIDQADLWTLCQATSQKVLGKLAHEMALQRLADIGLTRADDGSLAVNELSFAVLRKLCGARAAETASNLVLGFKRLAQERGLDGRLTGELERFDLQLNEMPLMELLSRRIFAEGEAGVLCLSERNWLVWQQQVALVFERSADIRAVIAEVPGDQVTLWGVAPDAVPASREAARGIFCLTSLFAQALDGLFAEMTGVTELSEARGVFSLEAKPSSYRHSIAGPSLPSLHQLEDAVAWARCGRLWLVPDGFESMDACPDCSTQNAELCWSGINSSRMLQALMDRGEGQLSLLVASHLMEAHLLDAVETEPSSDDSDRSLAAEVSTLPSGHGSPRTGIPPLRVGSAAVDALLIDGITTAAQANRMVALRILCQTSGSRLRYMQALSCLEHVAVRKACTTEVVDWLRREMYVIEADVGHLRQLAFVAITLEAVPLLEDALQRIEAMDASAADSVERQAKDEFLRSELLRFHGHRADARRLLEKATDTVRRHDPQSSLIQAFDAWIKIALDQT